MLNPYTIGKPVTGKRFYGCEAALTEVLESTRSCFCALSGRRFGKTSFLRQLEWRCDQENLNFLPVFWNLQGVETEADLCIELLRGMSGPVSKPRFAQVGLDAAQLHEQNLSLADLTLKMQNAALNKGKKLLFLCDECESLITLGQNKPTLLGRLRSILQNDGVRSVIVGSQRLKDLYQIKVDGSPFLHGWEPFTILPRLDPQNARDLIGQKKVGDGLKLPSTLVSAILEKTNYHPYLIQAVCSHLWEIPHTSTSLEQACSKAHEEVSQHAFADDFNYLSQSEKDVLHRIVRGETIHEGHETERLEGAGYITQKNDRWCLTCWFFERWLNENPQQAGDTSTNSTTPDKPHEDKDEEKKWPLDDVSRRAVAATRTQGFEKWANAPEVILAVVFTDIVGSVALSTRLGDQAMHTVRQSHYRQGDKLIEKHSGYRVKNIGDAFMAAFHTAKAALDFALELSAATGDSRVQIRAGIHVGTVQIADGDAFGLMVDLTARIIGMAEGAEIWLSDRAHSDIDDTRAQAHRSIKWLRHDNCNLKDFPAQSILWSVIPSPTPPDPKPKRKPPFIKIFPRQKRREKKGM